MEDTTGRFTIKRESGLPTAAPSADHRNGDWTDNDIYKGELAMDTETGRTYTRNEDGDIVNMDGGPASRLYKVLISQTLTNAPTVTVHYDMFGGAWSYVGVGHYRYTATGMFPTANKIWYQLQFNLAATASSQLINVSANTIDLKTYDSTGTLANGLLVGASLLIEVQN